MVGSGFAVPALRPRLRGANIRYPPAAFAVASYWAREAAGQVQIALRGLVDVGDDDSGEFRRHAGAVVVLGRDCAHQVTE